jgi:hypothetical protein
LKLQQQFEANTDLLVFENSHKQVLIGFQIIVCRELQLLTLTVLSRHEEGRYIIHNYRG